MRKGSVIALILALFIMLGAKGQETLVPLTRIHTGSVKKEDAANNSRIKVFKHDFIYVIDTLNLPFFDDFSTNRIKKYDAEQNDNNVSLKIDYDFSVNSNTPETLEYMTDTTYSILKMVNGTIIEQSNPDLYITLYENGNPVGYDTGWTNVITSFDQGTGLVTTDTLTPNQRLINTPDTFYRVADDSTLWTPPIDTFDSVRSVPYINNRFVRTPLTQGVATFDGTNDLGFPYDISSATSHGLADVLTSKPINLDSNMQDVFLSFFYQAGGLGNYPDEEDSLVVEFFDVEDSTWRFAYKLRPPNVIDSNWTDQIFLQVDGRKYLRSGFRFRFKNYATLSGSFDHWHLDYVRLGMDRDTTVDDSIIRDVAFVRGVEGFLAPFRSVPYSHYVQDPDTFETNQQKFTVVNLGLDTVPLIGLQYEIFDPQGNLVGNEVTAEPAVTPRTRLSTIFPVSDSPVYPDLGTDFADFTIRSRYTSVGLSNTYSINDTIYNRQLFRDYYAYDDGTAEQAYGLTGAGIELAYGFATPIGDSLRAIYFNFPQTLHDDNEDLPIRILVWDDLDAAPIYEALQSVDPQYTETGDFFRLELDAPVFVQDEFYVGFRQQEAKKVYVGFDANSNATRFTFYRIGEEWFESSLKGALMIRPSFSEEELTSVRELESTSASFAVYPNPARDMIQLTHDQTFQAFQLMDISGRLVRTVEGSSYSIDLQGLQKGMYIIRGIGLDGNVHTEKLIIQP